MRFENEPPSRIEPFLMSPTLPVMPGRSRVARAPPYQNAYSSAWNGMPPAGFDAYGAVFRVPLTDGATSSATAGDHIDSTTTSLEAMRLTDSLKFAQ